MKNKVLIIHCGGTISSLTGEKGRRPFDNFEHVIRNVLKSFKEDLPIVDIYEMSDLIDSADASLENYGMIAKTVTKNYKNYDGFVITHGTDTMAYAARSSLKQMPTAQMPLPA